MEGLVVPLPRTMASEKMRKRPKYEYEYDYDDQGKEKLKKDESEDEDVIFHGSMLIAACCRIQIINNSSSTNTNLITKSLNSIVKRLRRSSHVLSTAHHLCLHMFLAATPFLLQSRLEQVLLLALDTLGLAALCSHDINRKIVNDHEILVALLSSFSEKKRCVTKKILNVVLDIATTSPGRRKLRQFKAIDKLLLLYCQVFDFRKVKHVDSELLTLVENNVHMGFEKDSEILQLTLDTLTALLSDSGGNHLSSVSKAHVSSILSSLMSLWTKLQNLVWKQMQMCECTCGMQMHSSFLQKKNSLAKLIFRFSIEQDIADLSSWSVETVKNSIFVGPGCSFEHFVQHYWEKSPILIRKAGQPGCKSNIFSSLIDTTPNQSIDALLYGLLKGCVSCCPVTADNIDILSFVEEVKDTLGYPMIFGQDIRLVKSVGKEDNLSPMCIFSKMEQPFPRNLNETNVDNREQYVCIHDCILAFNMGYSIAIRGMEFRSHKIAVIANALSLLFGQASVGANLYLTPPMSQGLAVHYDDHCVLVFQLMGSKNWIILPPSKQLPRLYEPLPAVLAEESFFEGSNKHMLMEGDIFYIPRGFPHAAFTTGETSLDSEVEESVDFTNFKTCKVMEHLHSDHSQAESAVSGYSLHLTFSIEVEPPFEWEGMLHIALYGWGEYRRCEDLVSICGSKKHFYVFLELLHMSICNLGKSFSSLRKACTAAAVTPDFLDASMKHWETEALSPKKFFYNLIGTVFNNCSLRDGVAYLDEISQKIDEDELLPWMKWLQHLPSKNVHASKERCWSTFCKLLREVFPQNRQNDLQYENAFMLLKKRFCEEVEFDVAFRHFEYLLQKYRHARNRFINGMLSLHSQ